MPARIMKKDDLAGIEAFAPHAPGSADDPFVKAFADDRRPGGPPGGAGVGLVVAVLVLLAGLVSLVAVGDDGADLATSESTTTSSSTTSSTRPTPTTFSFGPTTSTTTVPTTATTPTTSGFGVGAGGSSSTTTTRPRTTSTLAPASTTTTRPEGNQPLVVTISVEPAQPVAGQTAVITVTYDDPDAPASPNCRSIHVEGGPSFDDPCATPECTDSGGAAGGGAYVGAEVSFQQTWAEAGSYEITASGESLQPYCGDRFGSVGTGTLTVDVSAAPAAGARSR